MNSAPQFPSLVTLPLRIGVEKWEAMDTWVLLDVLVGLRHAFQNSRHHPELWPHVSLLLSQRGIFKSHDKCRNRWKVLVAKYKRHCSQVLRKTKVKAFEFKEPVEQLLANQLVFDGQCLVRTFKNGARVKLAAADSDLAPLRTLNPRCEFYTRDPWTSVGN